MLKEVFLGIVLMIGGLFLAMAVLLKPDEPSKAVKETAKEPVVQELVPVKKEEATVDLQTETSVLEVKYRDRQAELEQKTAEAEALRVKQEQARELALQKSELEAQQISKKLEVKPRPESEALAQAEQKAEEQAKIKAAELAKAKAEQEAKEKAAELAKAKEKALQAQKTSNTNNKETKQDIKTQKPEITKEPKKEETTTPKTHVVKSGDSLIRLSRQYNIPVSAIAEMNGMGRNDALQRGRTIRLPSAKDIKDLEAKAQKREREAAAKKAQEQKRQDINERLTEARREAKRQGINEGYVVQVSLAKDQQKADELAKQYKQAGYAVQTIKEARGVRVVVGSERSKEAANILKEKINNDPSLPSSGAWVIRK